VSNSIKWFLGFWVKMFLVIAIGEMNTGGTMDSDISEDCIGIILPSKVYINAIEMERISGVNRYKLKRKALSGELPSHNDGRKVLFPWRRVLLELKERSEKRTKNPYEKKRKSKSYQLGART